MSEMTLIIGNKAYSSWSLRPWIAMKTAAIPFEETVLPLYRDRWDETISSFSGAKKVPVLKHGDLTVHDSLAIVEYLADERPDAMLWPLDIKRRAMARAYAAEMHSGFQALRANMAMNTRKIFKPKPIGPSVQKDIERIAEIWRTCLTTKTEDGPFLFGSFGAVDAMYAPVVSRFQTYQVQLDPICVKYMLAMMTLPAMQQWYLEAEAEPWSMDDHDSWGEEEEDI